MIIETKGLSKNCKLNRYYSSWGYYYYKGASYLAWKKSKYKFSIRSSNIPIPSFNI